MTLIVRGIITHLDAGKPMKKFICYVVLITLVAVQGCTTTYPSDLKMTSLDLVSVPTIDFRPNAKSHLTDNGGMYLLKLEVTTAEDILTYAKSNGYSFHIDSFLCNETDLNQSIAYDSIFVGKRDISYKWWNIDPLEVFDSSGLATYTIYLDLDSSETLLPEQDSFDLVNNPQDVCVFLTGRSMFEGFKSNVVKVKKEEIASRLNEKYIGSVKDK